MGSSYFILIVLAALAFRIITALVNEAAKRKETERAREAAQRRQAGTLESTSVGAAKQGGPQFGPASQAPMPVQTRPRAGKPLDDLAARRKQQIDQLRAGRDLRTGQPVPTRPQPAAPAASKTGSAITVSSMRTHEKSSELGEQRQAIQRQEDREAAEAKARRSQQSRVQHQRDTEAKGRQDQARRLMEKQLHLQAQAAQASAAVRAEKSATASGRLMSSLKSRLQGPAALRELMVLKEIIDPPVSQRELRH